MTYFLLLLMGVVVFWLVAKERSRGKRDRQIGQLAERLASIEARLLEVERSRAQPPPAPVRQPGSQTQNATVAGMSAPRMREEHPDMQAGAAERPTLQTSSIDRSASLEERLGANWLNKLGVVILVIGVAFFLAYQLRTLGALGKIVVGYGISAALLVGGLLLERAKNYRIFARAAIGGGWALLFFTTYAMYHLPAMQVLSSQALDLVLMLLVAMGMVWHSLLYKSQVVTGLAFLLAFFTVTISDVTIFSLLASGILALGLVFVVSREHWYELEFAGLIAVYFNHFIWLTRVLNARDGLGGEFPEFFPSLGLILLYWIVFRVAYIQRTPRNAREERISSLTAVLNSACLLALLERQSFSSEWSFWVLISLGAAEMALAVYAKPKRRAAFVILSSIASILWLAAIPFRFSGANWSLLWLLEAEALFFSGIRLREPVFRRLGAFAGFAAALQLFLRDILPILIARQAHADEERHFTAAIALGVGAPLFWLNAEVAQYRWKELIEDSFDAWWLRATSFLGLFAAAALIYLEVRPGWVAVGWAVLLVGLVSAAWFLRRPIFLAQALVLAFGVFARAVLFNLFLQPASASLFWNSRLFCVGSAALAVLLSLPFAFRLHKRDGDVSVIAKRPAWINFSMRRPEQLLFFVPLLMLTILLATEMRAGMITVAWSALGVVVFLFALLVGERSYRLAGLGLLLLGVGKILVIDVWNLSASDRYVTLIVMGVALLLVSFLYTRYRNVILKFL